MASHRVESLHEIKSEIFQTACTKLNRNFQNMLHEIKSEYT